LGDTRPRLNKGITTAYKKTGKEGGKEWLEKECPIRRPEIKQREHVGRAGEIAERSEQEETKEKVCRNKTKTYDLLVRSSRRWEKTTFSRGGGERKMRCGGRCFLNIPIEKKAGSGGWNQWL